MKKLIRNKFFERKTLTVAKDLLGKYLVRKIRRKIIREKITETEAYVGPHDLACHSARGKTKRNEPMFCEAGTIYVYFTYGMHWMFNIVTEERDFPAAVLIRGTEHYKGPGVLTRELKIDKALNGKPLGRKAGLWIEVDTLTNSSYEFKIKRTPRIGINYAGPIWSSKKYRFILVGEGYLVIHKRKRG